MNRKSMEVITRLTNAGISLDDAIALRRISMTLHRWHELECGDSGAYMATAVVRGTKNGTQFEYDDAGKPYMEQHVHSSGKVFYHAIPDRERGALKRLAGIMARYPQLSSYVQTDPRGASLYILRPGDVPAGSTPDTCYNHGIAVYR